jgi:hypothetical protein
VNRAGANAAVAGETLCLSEDPFAPDDYQVSCNIRGGSKNARWQCQCRFNSEAERVEMTESRMLREEKRGSHCKEADAERIQAKRGQNKYTFGSVASQIDRLALGSGNGQWVKRAAAPRQDTRDKIEFLLRHTQKV